MKKYLLALGVLASCATPRPATYAGFHGPAYLPARLARRPPQHVLDSLARRPHSLSTTK